jgi:hypothetical protein
MDDLEQAQPEAPRPGGPRALGVLSIIFASITLLFTLVSGCMAIATQRGVDTDSWMFKNTQNPEARAELMKRFHERVRPVTVTQTTVYIIMSVGLLLIGIGQLRYRSWARKLSVYWGALALLSLGVNVALSVLIVGPANQELFSELQRISKGMEAAVNSIAASWASSPWMLASTVVMYAPYPILLIIYFSRAGARRSMVA